MAPTTTGKRGRSTVPIKGGQSSVPVCSGLTLWPAAACLISELAAELGRLPAAELAATHVVLPTKRLPTWLFALLARERQAFVPPRCFTFDDFIAAYAAELAPNAAPLAPLNDLEQEFLLAGLLKESSYRHLRFGHEHEVQQLFAELTDWDLHSSAFERLAEAVADNVYLSEGGLDTLSERIAELAELYERFLERAASQGTEPGARRRARLSHALATELAAGRPLPAGRLYLVGLTSAQGVHAPLLHALARRPEARLWVNEPLITEHSAARGPLERLLSMIDAPSVHRRTLPGATRTAPHMTVQRADTPLAEAAQALALAETAVRSGLPPSSVAILVTNDAAYGKPLRLLLKSAGGQRAMNANLALGTPLAEVLAGTWAQALLEMVTSGEATPQVLAFLNHPLTLGWLKRRAAAAGARQAEAPCPALDDPGALSRELLASGVDSGLNRLADAPAVSDGVRAMLRAAGLALGPLVDPDQHAQVLPVTAWAQAFSSVLDDFILGKWGHATVPP